MIFIEFHDKNGGNWPTRDDYMGKNLQAVGWKSGFCTGHSTYWSTEATIRETVRICFETDRWVSDYLLFDWEPTELTVENVQGFIDKCLITRNEIKKKEAEHGRRLYFGTYHLPCTTYQKRALAEDDPREIILKQVRPLLDFQTVTAYMANSSGDIVREGERCRESIKAIRVWDPTLKVIVLMNARKVYKSEGAFYPSFLYTFHYQNVMGFRPDAIADWVALIPLEDVRDADGG